MIPGEGMRERMEEKGVAKKRERQIFLIEKKQETFSRLFQWNDRHILKVHPDKGSADMAIIDTALCAC